MHVHETTPATETTRKPSAAPEVRFTLVTVPETPLPRAPLAWIPYLWNHVLFPGRPDAVEPSPRAKGFVLFFLPALLLYPWLHHPLFEPDEGRYAQIPREMLERGDWIVPTLQGEPYLDKPPLFYWLVMASFSLFGFEVWAARLVPALCLHATLLVAWVFGRRMVGPRAALWGTFALTLAPGFLGMARLVLLDGLLTFLVTSALFAGWRALDGPNLHRRWWWGASFLCGLGILAKGPIALVLVGPPLWLQARLTNAPADLRWRHWWGFVGLSLAIALPWYAAICLAEPDFAGYFFWQHNLQRFLEPFDHERPFWFFVPVLLVGLLPVGLLLIPFVRHLLSGEEAAARSRLPAQGFLLVAGLWCFVFFSFSGCKLPTYILPAFPTLCLALGTFVAATSWARSRWTYGVGGVWIALLVIAHAWVVPHFAHQRSPVNDPEEMAAWCGDPAVPVFCFPRPVDSAAFFLGRADLVHYRTKDMDRLLAELEKHPRAVVLFGHRHSCGLLRDHLPPHLRMTATAPLGLCAKAKIERTAAGD